MWTVLKAFHLLTFICLNEEAEILNAFKERFYANVYAGTWYDCLHSVNFYCPQSSE